MSAIEGQFEQYVEKAAEALQVCTCPAGRNQHGHWRLVGPTCPACGDAEAKVRAVLVAVGPLIEEDTRLRMVAAAGRALARHVREIGSKKGSA